nr:ATP-binding protein [Clostridium sp. AM33-3]
MILLTIEEILAGESKNVEFKVQRPKDSLKYMKTVVAFSNGEGGRIVFGVDDDTREVVGIRKEIIFSEIDAITTAISDSCEPVVIPDVYLQTINDKTIIVAEISAGKQRPYYIKSLGIKDGTYIRVSGTSRPADRDLTAEMYYEDEGRSYDKVIRKDLTVTEKEIEETCLQMKEVAIANSKSKTQKGAIRDVTKNVLLSWGLLAEAEDGSIHPTNGYVFLLGKDDFLSQIQCGMFKGKTRAVFVDKREYGGPLWKQIDDAFQFVLRNIHLGAKLEGIYRKDIYELPPDSIRELIINAVMNCSFLQSSHIQVAIYDDRLEITSPGGLMPGVTLDKMKEGYSKIRNRALAHAFSYMNLIEAWGSGIPKLMEAMREYGLREPEFCDMEIGFRINLYRNTGKIETTQDTTQGTTQDTTQGISNVDRCKLTNADKEILNLIKEQSDITQKEIAAKLGWKVDRVKYYLNKMKRQDIVQRIGTSQKGYWKLLIEYDFLSR